MENQTIHPIDDSKMCLDIPGGLKRTVYPIQTWSCNNTGAQSFRVSNGQIINTNSNLCLDLKDGSTGIGTLVGQTNCNGSETQQFIYNANKTISPKKAPEKCLEVKGGVSYQGAPIVLGECQGLKHQQWQGAELSKLPEFAMISSSPTDEKVKVYEECNYTGKFSALSVGKYDIQKIGLNNDSISSIRIPPGLTVTLYEHAGFKGQSVVLTADNPCLTDLGWNDRTSSLVIMPVVKPDSFLYNSNHMTPASIYYQNGIWKSSKPGSISIVFKVLTQDSVCVQFSPYVLPFASTSDKQTYTIVIGGSSYQNKTFIIKNGVDMRNMPGQFITTPIKPDQETYIWIGISYNRYIDFGLGKTVGSNLQIQWKVEDELIVQPPVQYIGLGGFHGKTNFSEIIVGDYTINAKEFIFNPSYMSSNTIYYQYGMWKTSRPGFIAATIKSQGSDTFYLQMSPNLLDNSTPNQSNTYTIVIGRQSVSNKIYLIKNGFDTSNVSKQFINNPFDPTKTNSMWFTINDNKHIRLGSGSAINQKVLIEWIIEDKYLTKTPIQYLGFGGNRSMIKISDIQIGLPPSTSTSSTISPKPGATAATVRSDASPTEWQCLPEIKTPLSRTSSGDVQCMSLNQRDCMWVGNQTECQQLIEQYDKDHNNPNAKLIKPLVCGQEHQKVWGITGYDNPNHWCARGQQLLPQSSPLSLPLPLPLPPKWFDFNLSSTSFGGPYEEVLTKMEQPKPDILQVTGVTNTQEIPQSAIFYFIVRSIFLFGLVFWFTTIITNDALHVRVCAAIATLVVVIYSLFDALKKMTSDSKSFACRQFCPPRRK